MPRAWLSLCAALVVAAAACSGGSASFTLYRNGVANDTLRIHVATFDAKDGPEYNHDTCEEARELFQVQPTARSKYWCEKGHFKEKK